MIIIITISGPVCLLMVCAYIHIYIHITYKETGGGGRKKNRVSTCYRLGKGFIAKIRRWSAIRPIDSFRGNASKLWTNLHRYELLLDRPSRRIRTIIHDNPAMNEYTYIYIFLRYNDLLSSKSRDFSLHSPYNRAFPLSQLPQPWDT